MRIQLREMEDLNLADVDVRPAVDNYMTSQYLTHGHWPTTLDAHRLIQYSKINLLRHEVGIGPLVKAMNTDSEIEV